MRKRIKRWRGREDGRRGVKDKEEDGQDKG
jgi:hypothetical protein